MIETQEPTSAAPPSLPLSGTDPTPVYVTPPGWGPLPSGVFRKMTKIFRVVLLLLIALNVYILTLLVVIDDSGMATEVLHEGDEQIVAVYTIRGVIDGKAARKFESFVREINGDPAVKAVLLRVDSPGGGVAASNEMHELVKRIQSTDTPVVVSMGGLAASGGYMISAPAEHIVAEPSTLTGSIGVIAQLPNISGTLDKIGMGMQVVKSTHARVWKDQLSPFRAPKAYEKQHLVDILNAYQNDFEQIVREGRGKRLVTKEEEVVVGKDASGQDEIVKTTAPLNGQIYLAGQAKELGLIDQIGYYADACEAVKKVAKLSNPTFVEYSHPVGLLTRLLSGPASSSIPLVSLDTVQQLQTPRFMLLWQPEW
jgi:protease-4